MTQWVKQAIQRLDEAVDEPTRLKVMESCGRNCSKVNHIAIERGQARRAKFSTEEAFLVAEIKKPSTGTRLELDGETLYQVYTPATFTRPLRCYCALMRGLAPEDTVSRTYCYCSKGFVLAYWQAVLGRPVMVEMLETAVSGGRECRFKIGL